MRNKTEEKAIKMLRADKPFGEVARITGVSVYWLSVVANKEKM